MVSKILTKLNVPQNYIDIYEEHTLIVSMLAIVVCGVLAFYGYKLFKIALTLGGAVAIGIICDKFLTTHVEGFIGDKIPDTFAISGIVACVGALVGAFLALKAYNLLVFLVGCAAGYFLKDYVLTLFADKIPEDITAFITSDIGSKIYMVLIALVVGLVFLLFFKYLFIIATSLGGPATAATFAITLIMPSADKQIVLIAIIAGAVIGIVPMVIQFINASKMKSIRF